MYETEDLPYRRDAMRFQAEYEEERKKMHMMVIPSGEKLPEQLNCDMTIWNIFLCIISLS